MADSGLGPGSGPGLARLGLSTYRWNNNLKSILLLAAFPFLLLALFGGIFFLFGWFGLDAADPQGSADLFQSFGLAPVLGTGSPGDFAVSAMAEWWPIIFGIAAVWVLIGYLFNNSIIHMATGARPVTREQQPKLYNILENLCISRGLAMPRLYIIDTEMMNAYASGIDQKSYAITVTSGLLASLNGDEMEAVLAHELTHIIDRDCRLLIVTIVFTGMISFLAQMLWRSLQFASYTRGNSRKGGGAAILVFMLIAAVAFAIGYVLALILRFAISRRREYLADAGSVELTKNPDALISALLKISQNPDVPHVPSEVRQMFIENPPSAFDIGGLFATHPPIAARIRVLEALGGTVHDPASPAAPPAVAESSVPAVHSHGTTSAPPLGTGSVPSTRPRPKSPWEDA